MKFFRAIVEAAADLSSGLRLVKGLGRGVREIRDREIMQNRGLVSVPVAGDRVLLLQADDLVVAIAGDSADRPKAEPGETVLYANQGTFIRVLPDGTVRIQAEKIVLGADGDALPLEGVVTRQCLCAFTGGPHPDGSSTVFAKKGGL